MTSLFEPKTLREAVATIGVFARAIAERRIALVGGETAARLLSIDEPDPVELVNQLKLGGDRDAAWQCLQAVSLIVVAGGWQAVVEDPDASRAWTRAQKSWADVLARIRAARE
ncbi:hypothetical protein [Hansschlegelia sp. KR7-227]|uniref:hypothetical protein n=1 Tax=Hansschlegelia sp. KR7-227 TaxID=3400914 RepID=UPI003C124F0F